MIKKVLYYISTLILLPLYSIILKNKSLSGSTLLFVKIKKSKWSNLNLINCSIEQSALVIKGKSNSIQCQNVKIENSDIRIVGMNNRITIESGVKLKDVKINIRGTSCILKIEKNTTFGGCRIVNVGIDNSINIGRDCMFADNIEIWASDTHTIYDENENIINSEKPITIGNKVWIGSHVKILKGVTVSDGSIVGMGSIITKNTPPSSLSIGFPNTVIKENISWSRNYKTEQTNESTTSI